MVTGKRSFFPETKGGTRGAETEQGSREQSPKQNQENKSRLAAVRRILTTLLPDSILPNIQFPPLEREIRIETENVDWRDPGLEILKERLRTLRILRVITGGLALIEGFAMATAIWEYLQQSSQTSSEKILLALGIAGGSFIANSFLSNKSAGLLGQILSQIYRYIKPAMERIEDTVFTPELKISFEQMKNPAAYRLTEILNPHTHIFRVIGSLVVGVSVLVEKIKNTPFQIPLPLTILLVGLSFSLYVSLLERFGNYLYKNFNELQQIRQSIADNIQNITSISNKIEAQWARLAALSNLFFFLTRAINFILLLPYIRENVPWIIPLFATLLAPFGIAYNLTTQRVRGGSVTEVLQRVYRLMFPDAGSNVNKNIPLIITPINLPFFLQRKEQSGDRETILHMIKRIEPGDVVLAGISTFTSPEQGENAGSQVALCEINGEQNSENKTNIIISPGEIVLVKAPSGTGKSMILESLGGLRGYEGYIFFRDPETGLTRLLTPQEIFYTGSIPGNVTILDLVEPFSQSEEVRSFVKNLEQRDLKEVIKVIKEIVEMPYQTIKKLNESGGLQRKLIPPDVATELVEVIDDWANRISEELRKLLEEHNITNIQSDNIRLPFSSLSTGQQVVAKILPVLWKFKNGNIPWRLLVLDEPFANLDKKNREALAKVLAEIAKEVPIIIATHQVPNSLKKWGRIKKLTIITVTT